MFLLDWGELEGRLDCYYNLPIFRDLDKKIKNPVTIKVLSNLIIHPPEYPRKYSDDGIQLIRAQNVRPTGINLTDNPVYFSYEFLRHKQTIKPEIGNLLIVRSGVNAGDAAVVESVLENTIIGADTVLFKTHDINISRYLQVYFATNHGKFKLSRYITGATNKHLSPHNFGKIKVENLSIGLKIESYKVFIDALKLKEERKLEAQSLLKSIDNYLLGELGIVVPDEPLNMLQNRIFDADFIETLCNRLDPFYYQEYFEQLEEAIINCKYKKNVTKLRNCLSFIESGSRPKGGVKNIEEGILSFGGEHVNWSGQIEVKTPKFIPEKYHKNHRLTHTKLYDVLIVKDGATTGKIGIIVENEHVGQNINEHVFMLRFNNLNPYFVTILLNTNFYQKVIKRQITGATVTGLTKQAFKSILIPVPDMDTQIELVNIIKAKREEAFNLLVYAENDFNEAKKEVEKMILE